MKYLRYIYEGMTIVLHIIMVVLTIVGIANADGLIPLNFDSEGNPSAYSSELLLLIPLGIALLVNGFLTVLQRIKHIVDPSTMMRFKAGMAFIKGHTTLILCLFNAYMVFGAIKDSMPKRMSTIIVAGFVTSLAFGIIMWKMVSKAFQ